MMRSRFLVPILMMLPAASAAQVAVAPTILFIREDERFGAFMVSNQSATAQEIILEFRFGYPQSDSLGSTSMQYADSAAAARYGMDRWINAFPRRFVLPAGSQQTVRLLIRPPAGLADGTYWTRLITTSTPESTPVDTLATGVSARIVFRLQHVTTVLYRKGEARSGIEVGELTVTADSMGRPRATVPLKQGGNTPYFGTMRLVIRGESGEEVARTERTVGVYFESNERLEIAETLPPGTYTAELSVESGRRDIPPEHGVPVPTATTRASFTIAQ